MEDIGGNVIDMAHQILRIRCGGLYYDVKEGSTECPGCGREIGFSIKQVEDEVVWNEFKRRFPNMIRM